MTQMIGFWPIDLYLRRQTLVFNHIFLVRYLQQQLIFVNSLVSGVWEHYNAVELPGPRHFLFSPALAISYGASYPHKDPDFPQVLCFVMPFGQYTGGNLCFDDLNIEVALSPGQLACFPSARLTHSNTPVRGPRRSLVFFADRTLFVPCTKQKYLFGQNPVLVLREPSRRKSGWAFLFNSTLDCFLFPSRYQQHLRVTRQWYRVLMCSTPLLDLRFGRTSPARNNIVYPTSGRRHKQSRNKVQRTRKWGRGLLFELF